MPVLLLYRRSLLATIRCWSRVCAVGALAGRVGGLSVCSHCRRGLQEATRSEWSVSLRLSLTLRWRTRPRQTHARPSVCLSVCLSAGACKTLLAAAARVYMYFVRFHPIAFSDCLVFFSVFLFFVDYCCSSSVYFELCASNFTHFFVASWWLCFLWQCISGFLYFL